MLIIPCSVLWWLTRQKETPVFGLKPKHPRWCTPGQLSCSQPHRPQRMSNKNLQPFPSSKSSSSFTQNVISTLKSWPPAPEWLMMLAKGAADELSHHNVLSQEVIPRAPWSAAATATPQQLHWTRGYLQDPLKPETEESCSTDSGIRGLENQSCWNKQSQGVMCGI